MAVVICAVDFSGAAHETILMLIASFQELFSGRGTMETPRPSYILIFYSDKVLFSLCVSAYSLECTFHVNNSLNISSPSFLPPPMHSTGNSFYDMQIHTPGIAWEKMHHLCTEAWNGRDPNFEGFFVAGEGMLKTMHMQLLSAPFHNGIIHPSSGCS